MTVSGEAEIEFMLEHVQRNKLKVYEAQRQLLERTVGRRVVEGKEGTRTAVR